MDTSNPENGLPDGVISSSSSSESTARANSNRNAEISVRNTGSNESLLNSQVRKHIFF